MSSIVVLKNKETKKFYVIGFHLEHKAHYVAQTSNDEKDIQNWLHYLTKEAHELQKPILYCISELQE